MREIKFRIFDNEDKKFVSDNHQNRYFLYLDEEVGSLHVVSENIDLRFYGKDRFICMQYTGFQDLMEYDIYDGDILQVNPGRQDNSGILNCSVYFDEERGAWCVKGYHQEMLSEVLGYNICHIIGNIHENPELLNG